VSSGSRSSFFAFVGFVVVGFGLGCPAVVCGVVVVASESAVALDGLAVLVVGLGVVDGAVRVGDVAAGVGAVLVSDLDGAA
jgi:hypothetical protein